MYAGTGVGSKTSSQLRLAADRLLKGTGTAAATGGGGAVYIPLRWSAPLLTCARHTTGAAVVATSCPAPQQQKCCRLGDIDHGSRWIGLHLVYRSTEMGSDEP